MTPVSLCVAGIALAASMQSAEVVSVAPANERDTEMTRACRGWYGPSEPDVEVEVANEISGLIVDFRAQGSGIGLRVVGPSGEMCLVREFTYGRWPAGRYQLSIATRQRGPAPAAHIVLRPPTVPREPAARPLRVGTVERVADRHLAFHYPQLSTQQLVADPSIAFALLRDVPKDLFVFYRGEPVLVVDDRLVLTTDAALVPLPTAELVVAEPPRARLPRRLRRDDGFSCDPATLAGTSHERLYRAWAAAREVLRECQRDARPRMEGCERPRRPGDPGCDPYEVPGAPMNHKQCVLPYQRAMRRACRAVTRERRRRRARELRATRVRLRSLWP